MSQHEIWVEYSINGGEWEKTNLWDLMESPIVEKRKGHTPFTNADGVELDAWWDSYSWDGTEITFHRSAYGHPLWTLRIRAIHSLAAFLEYLDIESKPFNQQLRRDS